MSGCPHILEITYRDGTTKRFENVAPHEVGALMGDNWSRARWIDASDTNKETVSKMEQGDEKSHHS